MSYLSDYLHFTGGTECPERYRIWAGLSLLAVVIGRRSWVVHGRYPFYPSLYVALVGEAGSGKSTAKSDCLKILKKEFPHKLTSASFQSHQDIIDQMCNAEPETWKLSSGNIGFQTSFLIACNEFQSLLSTDKKGMVEFLIDVHDCGDDFSTGYKNQRLANPERKQRVDNPFVSVLACAVPKWFMGNLKMDLFDGGLGRRLIIVYENKSILNHDPIPLAGSLDAKARLVAHLHSVEQLIGEVKRTDEAMAFWKDWYYKSKKRQVEDPILMQFQETNHPYILKIALLLALSEYPPATAIDAGHLEFAVKLFNDLEPNIIRLTSGIGRNELAGIGHQVLEHIERIGQGAMPLVHIKKVFGRYLNRPEFKEVLDEFIETGRLYFIRVDFNGVERDMLMLPKFFGDYMQRRMPTHPAYLDFLRRQKESEITNNGEPSVNQPEQR